MVRVCWALLLISPWAGSSVLAEEFFVGAYNVENLFDTVDDPAVEGDEEYIPSAPKKWDQPKLDRKLANLARAISAMGDGKGPAILGLEEIENVVVVEQLANSLKPLGRDYQIVHRDSPSERGIDCALIYDAKLFELVDKQFHRVPLERPSRDIVEAHLQRNGQDLYFFVNHWPSRYNDEQQRMEAARVLRARVDAIAAQDKDADIVMAGDFNDTPPDRSLKFSLRTGTKEECLKNGFLFDTMWPIHTAGEGTNVYNDQWQALDHVIVSPGMLNADGFAWKENSTVALKPDFLLFHPRPPAIPRPNRSYTKDNFHKDGTSDHLAVGCVIVLSPAK
jgi:predicted extracellular nuclease